MTKLLLERGVNPNSSESGSQPDSSQEVTLGRRTGNPQQG
ncbi:hypothetical protein MA5S0422_3055 [Mycobacteroides abscessus 5S-0422]|uniref:Uncharacterized protein n=1 Tax=Mycobacteroides abscessus subsp. bolletii 1513 TaxID=1299321 RepID=X8DQ68_9MYCO|nr:hypothetical protein MA5S0421_2376 [Mycobacteroides abscessus 5S-0421]EIU11390.1 hypothetical protein MA5S0304_2122 [Mycobacteroides abscessus 5S-0304]EIU13264.1 hypothetical protein MA5S0422_3055 [Mycobacteroides abscessus 5S-0422]EIU21675.1 hypothetical protein MA5S0708_5144 [Mycobacteroides abscessus 5S-0708]EIU26613.1 hypothetical protein MA5S0817_1668 [Mycobacteroides abscessus 5S-0817]EIU29346.1 hypothetical protein MA5S1212_4296 [Mycobacteroides abscessus 5S-1212]EIU44621.1 hypothet